MRILAWEAVAVFFLASSLSFADQRQDLIRAESKELQHALDVFMLNKPIDADDFAFEIERSKNIVAGLDGDWAVVILGGALDHELTLGLGCTNPHTKIHVLNDYEFTINLPSRVPKGSIDVRYTAAGGNEFHTYANFSDTLKADGKDVPPNPQPGDIYSAARFMRTVQVFRPSTNILIIQSPSSTVLPLVFEKCQPGF
jgi:hypothetical protein